MLTPEENTAKDTYYDKGNIVMTGCCHATDGVLCPVCGHSITLGKTECPMCHIRIIMILRKRKIST